MNKQTETITVTTADRVQRVEIELTGNEYTVTGHLEQMKTHDGAVIARTPIVQVTRRLAYSDDTIGGLVKLIETWREEEEKVIAERAAEKPPVMRSLGDVSPP